MGQDSTKMIDESTPPNVLKSRDLAGIAEYVNAGKAKRIVVMTGAGISTSAGIPDFRSPDTGLYANLARLNLPYAEAVFDISYFRNNPAPFYTLAHELYPGKYRPTIAHSFTSLLNDKGRLLKCFTQNIDCLEREAGVPDDKIVEAHGSFAKQRCIECKTEYPDDQMQEFIKSKDIPYCSTPQCNGLVKPDIVFFGEALPESFHANRSLPETADLCIVMGTSLSVQPFASLPMFCSDRCPRILINKEQVGGLGSRPDDVLLLGDCDEGVQKLADACGWGEELRAKWQSTRAKDAFELKEPEKKEQTLDEQIDKLTGEVDKTLKLSKDHSEHVRRDLKVPILARYGSYQTTDPNSLTEEQIRKDIYTSSDNAPHVDDSKPRNGLPHVFPHLDEVNKNRAELAKKQQVPQPKDEKL